MSVEIKLIKGGIEMVPNVESGKFGVAGKSFYSKDQSAEKMVLEKLKQMAIKHAAPFGVLFTGETITHKPHSRYSFVTVQFEIF